MPPELVIVAPDALATLRTAAVGALPREMAGLLGGSFAAGQTVVTAFAPLSAVATHDGFAVNAPAFAAAEGELRARGLCWLGFVHSHPDGAAVPSLRDRDELWPDCVQIIVAVHDGHARDVAAFWRVGDEIMPLPLVLEPVEVVS